MEEKRIEYGLIRRITVDLDTRDENSLKKCLDVLKKYGFTKDLEVRTSPSGNGYHIIAWSDKGYTLEELLKIRKEAGDDDCRVFIDGLGNRLIQVLFTRKNKRTVRVAEILEEEVMA